MSEPTGTSPAVCSQTAVLLGASNLRLCLETVVRTLQSFHPSLNLMMACGHGRSYGQWSSIPFRALPGIAQCGLWDALALRCASEPQPAPRALVTDVGNDLLFGSSPTQILEWVETCCRRLHDVGAELIVTLPPLARLERLTPVRFWVARTILFPASGLQRQRMMESVLHLRAGLLALSEKYSAAVVDPPAEWYGIDPIHIRRSARRKAWEQIFDRWPPRAQDGRGRRNEPETPAGLFGFRPDRGRYFGREQLTPQPVYRSDELTLSFY